MLRLRMIETALMDSEMQRELPEAENPDDPGYRIAFAFRRPVNGSRAISLASRSRLHRIHEHSHHTLRELQKDSPSASAGAPQPMSPAPVQPEPLVAEAPPSTDDEKLRNEPTPAARKNRQLFSITRHIAVQSCSGRSRRRPRRVTA